DTLINALLYRKTQLSNSDDAFRPGLVHRIDKGTSGLLVLAKNEEAHNHLAKQFVKKTIHRKYWAMTFSYPRDDEGTIESFLVRDPRNRQRYQSSDNPEGKKAITHYKVLSRSKSFGLLELVLETGRTHQIRVHLSSQMTPIVADDVYNGKKQAKNLKNQELKKLILEMDRFCLHAKELGFNHPETHENMIFTSAIPEDLSSLFELGGFSDYLGQS
ncbi:MAG: RluA family pseudouridine synthase, partial [Bdellovibrionales bacterium]|nr:RluA family pseudouridine synthase [Bdellovibrionales bacterium]NQZ18301.1 RluA family pseudouridine synthase [Bdellovibrionales bacterium]